MRMNVSLRQLRVFCAVYERRSFTSAAEEMHMTQSAVSKLCAELESELGLPLFERTTRRIVPCDGAAELYEYAQEVLTTMQLAGRRLSALRALERGVVSVAASPMMMHGLFGPVIQQFHTAHPAIVLDLYELSTDETIDYVRTGKCDLGIVSVSDPDPQLSARVVYAEPLFLACAPEHPLVQHAYVTWRAVADFEHVTLRNVYSTRRIVDRILHAQGLELRSTIQVGTLATALAMTKAIAGVTLIPGYAREQALNLGLRVLAISAEEAPQLHKLSLLTRKGLKPSIAATAFIQHLEAGFPHVPAD